MNQELYAELETRTAHWLKAIEAKAPDFREAEDSYLQKLSEPHFQQMLARGLAETYLLLDIAHERGILEPDDMMLPEPVMRAKFGAEGDSFQAALEAMDRLQPAETG